MSFKIPSNPILWFFDFNSVYISGSHQPLPPPLFPGIHSSLPSFLFFPTSVFLTLLTYKSPAHAPCSSSIPSLWSFLHTIYFLCGNRMFSEFSTAYSLLLLPSQITFPAECNQLYFLPLYFFFCSSGHCLGWVSGSFPPSCGKSYPSHWKTGRLKVFWRPWLPL